MTNTQPTTMVEAASLQTGQGKAKRSATQHRWLSAFALTLLILFTAQPAQAADPYPVNYQAPVTDLSVKVWGGRIDIRRGYFEGVWHPNTNWMPLVFTYDNLDSSVKTVTRAYTDYSKVAPGVFQDKYHNLIRQTDSGFRWNDPQANWIEYTPTGAIKTFGNRNGTMGSFQYSGPRISGILDHNGSQVLWFDYNASNQLSRVRDTTGRKVDYTWSGTTLTVLDANGHTWTYAVAGQGATITVTDPEARVTVNTYHTNGERSGTTYPDGSKNTVAQDYDNAKSIFYTRETAPGGKVTETWFELKQDRGRGEFLRRDINGTTVAKQSLDTATRTTTVTDARGLNTAITRDQWDNITKVA
ncbi:MAG: hypothetical protein Q8N51_12520, partial [Gammaproteobacteria bacterium]|nr:hypothetical protein [Gammaproteobacteria bacterium]